MADLEGCDRSEKEDDSFEQDKNQGEFHMKSDRRYRRELVSCDDAFDQDEDYNLIENVFVDNRTVLGWCNVIPNPKYIQPVPKKKKVESIVDAEEGEMTSSRSSIPVRRNYELDFVSCPAWKIGVEPMTYRYMPNNGRYRAFKLAKRLDTPKAFKKSFNNSKLSTDKTHLHKEIQRELRKEFELFISLERQKSSLFRQQQAHQRLKEEKKRKTISSTYDKNSQVDSNKHQLSKDSTGICDSVYEVKGPEAPRLPAKLEPRYGRPPANLPPLDIQQLTQEQGQYYLEQVSSRLRELEKTGHINRATNGKLEEEGYLSASAYKKTSQSDPGYLCSPRDGHGKNRNSGNQFNKSKKLPTINDHIKETDDVSQKMHTQPSITNGTDSQSISSELRISKFSSVNSSVDTQNVTQSSWNITHPLMYSPPDVGKMHETVYSESPLHNISKGAARRARGDSGHIQLFSDYKLRKASDNPFNEVNPETVNIIDNIRSSYNLMDSAYKEDDDVSLESRVVNSINKDSNHLGSYTRFVDPRGQNFTPDYKDYAKSQVLRNESGKSQHENEQLHHTSKEYVAERKKIGANPYYVHKARSSNPATIAAADTLALGKPLQGVSLLNQQKTTKHAAVRGNIMPEVMVRRAEIAVTNKRII